ncbi:MAG: hypothetical protein R3Y64_09550 [Peptostreptococcaceae bacterium]
MNRGTLNALERENIGLFKLSNLSNKGIREIRGIGKVREKEIVTYLDSLKDRFVDSDEYVFTKKRYIKAEGRKSYSQNKSIIDKLNGRPVIDGKIYNYTILKDWCIGK